MKKVILIWYNLGVALEYLNRSKEAIECFDLALSINPNFHLAKYGKGIRN